MGEIEKELRWAVAALRPVLSWEEALARVGMGVEVWHHPEPGVEWPMTLPPEDCALPPLMDWSGGVRRLVEAACREWYPWLEPGTVPALEWPPRGSLEDSGQWDYADPDECAEHGDERSVGCAECEGLRDEVQAVVHSPAVWSWHVNVLAASSGDSSGTAESWLLGTTEFDPREVEYCLVHDGDSGALLVTTVSRVVAEEADRRRRLGDDLDPPEPQGR